MKRMYLLIAGLIAISAVALINCSGKNEAKAENNSITKNEAINNNTPVPASANTELTADEKGIIHLSSESFRSEIFDYSKNSEWKYNGKVPAIIDFYADWCRPCKMLAPTLEELQKEYGGKIQVYKVNTDNNPEVSQVFGIRGIPALLFIPLDGEPQMSTGLLPKETLVTNITDILKVSK